MEELSYVELNMILFAIDTEIKKIENKQRIGFNRKRDIEYYKKLQLKIKKIQEELR